MKGLFLIWLLSISTRSTEAQDFNNLASITKFLDLNYDIGQYSAAINVPQEQCHDFKPSTVNFLKNDKGNNVKNIIKDETNPVYKGEELIAAGVQKPPHTAHSEFLLLNPANKSPLTYLLNKRNDGCVVFYTLNSPCMNTCLTGKYNIIPGVDELKNYQGIKAFAFKNIWTHDQGEPELKEKLKTIADRVPLYRCQNNKQCILCGEPNSNAEIPDACLSG
nr:uncharacterized protein LOC129438604 [Misgurnus anguillicaudatus]